MTSVVEPHIALLVPVSVVPFLVVLLIVLAVKVVQIGKASGVAVVEEVLLALLGLLVEEDAGAVGAEDDVLAGPHEVGELGGKDHVATRAYAALDGDDAEAELAADDALELEQNVLVESGGDFLLPLDEAGVVGVLCGDLLLDAGALLGKLSDARKPPS